MQELRDLNYEKVRTQEAAVKEKTVLKEKLKEI